MALHFTNTTPKILIYTAGGMGESFQEYLMDKVAILDHIIEDAPHDGDTGQIEAFRGIVKEHGKYDIFFNLGETAMFDYLAIADELADRTFYIDTSGDIDLTAYGVTNAEPVQDNTIEDLWDRCMVGATSDR